jgi:hypothetical protein
MASLRAALARHQLIWFFVLTLVPMPIAAYQRLGVGLDLSVLELGTAGPAAVLLAWAAGNEPPRTRRTAVRLIAFVATAAAVALVLRVVSAADWLATLVFAVEWGFLVSCLWSPTCSVRELVRPLLQWRQRRGVWAFALLAYPLLVAAIVVASRIGQSGDLGGGGSWSDLARSLLGAGVVRMPWVVGWYGFAGRRLMARLSPLLAGLLLGTLWTTTAWLLDAPLPPADLLARFFLTNVATALVSLWLLQRARGGLLPLWVLGAIASASFYGILWVGGTAWFTRFDWIMAGAECLLAACLVVGWRMWRGPTRELAAETAGAGV